MSPGESPTPLPYGAVRLRWCGLALKAFVERWGVYLFVTALVLSAGASGWLDVLQALAAALVLPLFWASQHGALLLPAMLLQALAGAGVVWGARGMLWPAHWAESERALPLARRTTARSDLLVVLLTFLPLLFLYVAGTASVLAHRPPWLQPTQGSALLALVLATLMSLVLGVALLQWQRGYRMRGSPVPAETIRTAMPGSGARSLSSWRSLVMLPLWRGPARRTGRALALGATAMLAAGLLPAALGRPAAWPWCLAASAAIALLAATRVRHLALLEMSDVLQACAVLPIHGRRLRAAVRALGLLPLAVGLVALLLAVWVAPPAGLRPAVLLAWAFACAGACAFEVFVEQPVAADKSARWWFSLIVCVCLASEVLA